MEALLTEVAILAAMALLTWVADALRRYIRTKASKEDLEILEKLAEVATWAVEQRGSGVFASKKDAAREIIFTELKNMKKLGKFPTSTVDAAIEAAVGTSFHYLKHTKESISE